MAIKNNTQQWMVVELPAKDHKLYKNTPMFTIAPGETNYCDPAECTVRNLLSTHENAVTYIRTWGSLCAAWDIDYSAALKFALDNPDVTRVETRDAIILRSEWSVRVFPASTLVFDYSTRLEVHYLEPFSD